MSCTRYKIHRWKDKFTPGNNWEDPKEMIPGNYDFEEMKRQEKLEHIHDVEKVKTRVDHGPPEGEEFQEHLKVFKLRNKERERLKIEADNRWLAARLAYVWQTKGCVDHINDDRYLHSLRKDGAIIQTRDYVRENIKMMHNIYSYRRDSVYARDKFLKSYDELKRKQKIIQKYDRDVWQPIWNNKYQKQVRRGRGLNPNHAWRF